MAACGRNLWTNLPARVALALGKPCSAGGTPLRLMDEEPAPSAAGEGATISLFNKPKRNKNTRKRETPVDDDGGGDGND